LKKEFDPKNYWEKRLAENYNLKGVGDIGLSESYNVFLYRVRSNVFKYITSNLKLNRSSSVLDIGSGTGFYIGLWIDAGIKKIMGSDLTETAVEQLQTNFPNNEFMQLDIGRPLAPELACRQFDVVSAYDMLFHIVDDSLYKRALMNFSKLVKPGGTLVFSDNLMSDSDLRIEHQVSRLETDVKTLMQENGFVLKRVVPMFVFMNDPVRTQSRIMKRLFSSIYVFASKGEWQGKLIGSILFPIELLLIRLLGRGPSTEIFVWQRNDG